MPDLTLIVAGLIAFVILLFVLWKLPEHLVGRAYLKPKERIELTNNARQTLVQLLGGGVVILGLFFTWGQLSATNRNIEVARQQERDALEGQITDRFTHAVDQLGSGKLDIRLGGIYALQRVAHDSPRDAGPILDILSAFVREHTPMDRPCREGPHGDRMCTDTQSILAILSDLRGSVSGNDSLDLESVSRRDVSLPYSRLDGALFTGDDLSGAVLTGARLVQASFAHTTLRTADLEGAFLEGANFDSANVTGARLNRARLDGAYMGASILRDAKMRSVHLEKATLDGAHLENADLCQAHARGVSMNGAYLTGSSLQGADLSDASFQYSSFKGADLEGTDLRGADLSTASGLTREQILSAIRSKTTQLPPGFKGLQGQAGAGAPANPLQSMCS